MNALIVSRRKILLALSGAAVIAACTSTDRTVTGLKSPGDPNRIKIDHGNIQVCKAGGPPGSYTFHLDITGGGHFTLGGANPDTTVDFNGSDPACWSDAYAPINDGSWGLGQTATVKVTETNIPAGVAVDSIYLTDGFGTYITTVIKNPVIVLTVGLKDLLDVAYFNVSLPTATCAAITNAVQGVAITPVQLTATGGSGGYTFTSSDLTSQTGLQLSSSGMISGTPSVNGTFTYHITVTDSAGNTSTISCTVTIAPPLSLTCAAITNAVQGVPIAPVQLVATGGTGGYTFSSSDLTAQTGLVISSTGVISGTPTVSGTFSYHVTVTDSAGNTSTIQCSVTLYPPPSASCVSISAIQNAPITPVTLTGSGGTGGTYTFSATGLPAGITISTSGTISGTPTVSGTFNYTVTITDNTGHSGTVNCSVTVLQAKTFSIGPSSMEGHLTITANTWFNGGYSFKFVSNAHVATQFTVTAKVEIAVTCPHGGGPGGTILIPLGTRTYSVPAGNTDWLPTGDQNSILSWMGAVETPNLCGGFPMDNAIGGVFTASVNQNPASGSLVDFRFKYRNPAAKGKTDTNCTDPNAPKRNDAATCGASWSQTVRDP